MKTSRYVAALVCCVIVLASTACATGAAATAPAGITELPVLEIARDFDDAAELAEVFLGAGATQRESFPGDDTVTYVKGDSSVGIDADGVVTFSGPEERDNLSVEWDQARAIAVDFLAGTVGVPDGAVGPEPGTEPAQEPGSTTYASGFEWRREIDGVPVAGAQWIGVFVGGEGRVMSMLYRWHDVVGEGEMVPISVPEDVIDPAGELIGGSCPDCSPKPTAEDVANARLVYHVPFTSPVTQMTPAWEVTAGQGDEAVQYYFHAQTGEPLAW